MKDNENQDFRCFSNILNLGVLDVVETLHIHAKLMTTVAILLSLAVK